MSLARKSGLTGKRRQRKASSSVSRRGARVDAPHPNQPTPESSPSPTVDPLIVPEQEELLRHVTSLSEELERQNEDLQRRQEMLHQQIAELESERRQCRLWASELEHQLGGRETELDERSKQLDQEAKRLSERESQLESRRQGVKRAAQKLAHREARTRAQAGSHEELESDRSRPELANVQLEQDLARRDKELAERQSNLEEQVAELEQQRKDLVEARVDLEKTRREKQASWDRQWARFQETSRRREESLTHQHDLLQRRARDLEIRQAATEQLRSEVDQTHREGLEMRLALEELWARLTQKMEPGVLAQELANVRAQLADYYRYANERLTQGHRQLREAKASLECQKNEYCKEKEDLLEWVDRRRRELDEEEHEMRRRAADLEQREAACSEQQQRWHDERLAYQSQIRSLLGTGRQLSS